MPSFFCAYCNYTTERKNNYTKHINTKKHTQNFLKTTENQETAKNPHFSSLSKKNFLTFPHLKKNPHFILTFKKNHPHPFLTLKVAILNQC